MVAFKFKHVCLESWSLNMPANELSSAQIEDRLAPLYERLQIPFGTLEKLSGIRSRYLWDIKVFPSEPATVAARGAIAGIGFDPALLKALFNCSVTRDYFEPATASIIHRNLEMSEDSITMDISNACIGFSDGILMLAQMIEAGVVKAGVIVSAEHVTPIIESTFRHIQADQSLGRDRLLKLVPTFTLGGGSASFVLCHDSIATRGHRLIGAVARSATQHSNLCNGNADFSASQGQEDMTPIMETQSSELINSAAKLGNRTWKDASPVLGWSREDVSHIFCHQVGRQVNRAFYDEMGLDIEKEFTVYQRFGNLVSAAMPAAFITGTTEKTINRGDKVLLTAFGSGLNSIFLGLEW